MHHDGIRCSDYDNGQMICYDLLPWPLNSSPFLKKIQAILLLEIHAPPSLHYLIWGQGPLTMCACTSVVHSLYIQTSKSCSHLPGFHIPSPSFRTTVTTKGRQISSPPRSFLVAVQNPRFCFLSLLTIPIFFFLFFFSQAQFKGLRKRKRKRDRETERDVYAIVLRQGGCL